jgi:hypothetical protein
MFLVFLVLSRESVIQIILKQSFLQMIQNVFNTLPHLPPQIYDALIQELELGNYTSIIEASLLESVLTSLPTTDNLTEVINKSVGNAIADITVTVSNAIANLSSQTLSSLPTLVSGAVAELRDTLEPIILLFSGYFLVLLVGVAANLFRCSGQCSSDDAKNEI